MAHARLPSDPSPFLQPRECANNGSLAILHLRRDQLTPTLLSERDDANEGYDEGKVTNTRFGSFPHSTLINLPWGSQVRASKVDTGSRGRKATGNKRKRDTNFQVDATAPLSEIPSGPKAAVVAQSGFAHLIPPTPESWTISLPHRTQVVYTPDYSLILQRLKARPGTQLIEAGAGSGSFSHAAARAVYSGLQSPHEGSTGKVWSFEFHEQRVEKLRKEIADHGLDGVIELSHRDVYEKGFFVPTANGLQAIKASAVFLDLPAPWLALPHLTRPQGSVEDEAHVVVCDSPRKTNAGPLSSNSPVHICCFLPCIEQVQRTVTALQSHSWQHIDVIEVAAHRIEIRRERVGINEEGLRGVNAVPANVEEALIKIREDESRTQVFHQLSQRMAAGGGSGSGNGNGSEKPAAAVDRNGVRTKQERLREIQEASEQRKLFLEGRLIHRAEPELKMHTSYLVFAILPRDWTEEDEARARAKWTYPLANSAKAEAKVEANANTKAKANSKAKSKTTSKNDDDDDRKEVAAPPNNEAEEHEADVSAGQGSEDTV